MIVKNPTVSTQNYTFTTLSLTPGATAEIDNSFVENTQFQLDLQNGIITIIKYIESDANYHDVTICISNPPNHPSNDQKGAMVTADSPSATNPFVTYKQINDSDVYVKFDTSSTIQIEGIKTKAIWVNNERVLIPSPITYDIAASNAINSSGGDTGSLFPVSAVGYLYFSNSQATLGGSLLLSSQVAPTYQSGLGYYLNSTKDWKFVGWLKTNASRQLDSVLSVSSFFNINDSIYKFSGSGTQAAVSPNVVEDITSLTPSVLLPPFSFCDFKVKAVFTSTAQPNIIDILVDSVVEDTIFLKDINIDHTRNFSVRFENNTSSPSFVEKVIAMRGTDTTHSIKADDSFVEVVRHSYKGV